MYASSRVGTLLDDGGNTLLRFVCGVCGVVVVGMFVVMAIPVMVLVAAFAATGTIYVPRPAGPAAPTTSASVPSSPPTAARAADLPPVGAPHGEASAVDAARRYLGVPYLFGGTNPAVGLDCSGLVQLVYRQIGLNLPRTAQQQYDATRRVAHDDLQPGDLVFFARTYADPHDWITHVGIYIGGGLQINAPTEGQVVSVQPVFSGYWGEHFASGGRLR